MFFYCSITLKIRLFALEVKGIIRPNQRYTRVSYFYIRLVYSHPNSDQYLFSPQNQVNILSMGHMICHIIYHICGPHVWVCEHCNLHV